MEGLAGWGAGARAYMEDKHTVVSSFKPLGASGVVEDGVERSYFAVFDGPQAAVHYCYRGIPLQAPGVCSACPVSSAQRPGKEAVRQLPRSTFSTFLTASPCVQVTMVSALRRRLAHGAPAHAVPVVFCHFCLAGSTSVLLAHQVVCICLSRVFAVRRGL